MTMRYTALFQNRHKTIVIGGMTNGASATSLFNLRSTQRAEIMMPAQHKHDSRPDKLHKSCPAQQLIAWPMVASAGLDSPIN